MIYGLNRIVVEVVVGQSRGACQHLGYEEGPLVHYRYAQATAHRHVKKTKGKPCQSTPCSPVGEKPPSDSHGSSKKILRTDAGSISRNKRSEVVMFLTMIRSDTCVCVVFSGVVSVGMQAKSTLTLVLFPVLQVLPLLDEYRCEFIHNVPTIIKLLRLIQIKYNVA